MKKILAVRIYRRFSRPQEVGGGIHLTSISIRCVRQPLVDVIDSITSDLRINFNQFNSRPFIYLVGFVCLFLLESPVCSIPIYCWLRLDPMTIHQFNFKRYVIVDEFQEFQAD